ncbi:MAG TPA: pyridoxal 5'-phosphate synthase glutaminase subunit PdxT [Spirochaetia bacterium]|nr:pyridoxal 5'-phosphate synthase glutaminase subunit PdxT [Spirochaetia bacterium]
MKIGVLAFQGDFQRHYELLLSMGADVRYIRSANELEEVGALVLPGGESTTIGKLLVRFGMMEPLRARIEAGMPVFGTCAGAILLAKEIEGSSQDRIGVMNIRVARNAYGRQIESFEADLQIDGMTGEPMRAVFIRAPIITEIGADVEVVVNFEGSPVVVRQGAMLAATFHPELTGDNRLHRLFLDLATTPAQADLSSRLR